MNQGIASEVGNELPPCFDAVAAVGNQVSNPVEQRDNNGLPYLLPSH